MDSLLVRSLTRSLARHLLPKSFGISASSAAAHRISCRVAVCLRYGRFSRPVDIRFIAVAFRQAALDSRRDQLACTKDRRRKAVDEVEQALDELRLGLEWQKPRTSLSF